MGETGCFVPTRISPVRGMALRRGDCKFDRGNRGAGGVYHSNLHDCGGTSYHFAVHSWRPWQRLFLPAYQQFDLLAAFDPCCANRGIYAAVWHDRYSRNSAELNVPGLGPG